MPIRSSHSPTALPSRVATMTVKEWSCFASASRVTATEFLPPITEYVAGLNLTGTIESRMKISETLVLQ